MSSRKDLRLRCIACKHEIGTRPHATIQIETIVTYYHDSCSTRSLGQQCRICKTPIRRGSVELDHCHSICLMRFTVRSEFIHEWIRSTFKDLQLWQLQHARTLLSLRKESDFSSLLDTSTCEDDPLTNLETMV